MPFHIVLHEPLIPSNTGNIARTCAGTGTSLHLIRPLGFRTDDKALKRAGLDYWHAVDIFYYDSIEELWEKYPHGRFFYVETSGGKYYHQFAFQDGDFFVFGKETKGIPKEVLIGRENWVMKIPMSDATRSLNLSNAAAIVLFEGLRQIGFPGMD